MAIVSDVEIRLRADIARLQQDLTRARNQVSGFTSGVKNMVGGLFAGFAIGSVISKVVSAQREFDKLHASLVTVTGSSAGASKAFEAIQKLAAKTPFDLQQVTEGFLKLRNMGLTPSERAIMSYGNTAAAMGKNLNQMVEAVADATTGEFERLKEFGIKAKQNGDQVALTFQGVTKTIGNNAEEIESYLMAIGETQFAGGMERQAATLDGALSNLGDTFLSTLAAFSQGSGFGSLLQGSVLALTESLADLGAMFKAIGGAAEDEGKKVEAIGPLHSFLTTVFETITVVGLNVAYVFKTIGKDVGAFAAQAAALFNGGLKGLADGSTVKAVRAIGNARVEEAKRERAEVDAATARVLQAAGKRQEAERKANEEGKKGAKDYLGTLKIVGDGVKAQSDKQKKAAEEAAKAAKKAADEEKRRLEQYQSMQSAVNMRVAETAREAAGLAELTEGEKAAVELTEQLRLGKVKLTEAEEAQLRAGYAAIDVNLGVAESQKRAKEAAEAMAEVEKDLANERARALKAAEDEATTNERAVETFGMTAAAIERLELARLKEQLAQRASMGLTLDEIENLEQLIAVKERSAAALAKTEELERVRDFWTDIERVAHDTFVSIADGGKDAWKRLKDTAKNMFFDWLYQMTLKKWIINIGASLSGTAGVSGIANAAGLGGGAGGSFLGSLSSGAGIIGSVGNLYSAITGGMTLAGGLGTGFMGSLAGGLMGAGAGSGLTSSLGLSLGNSIAGVLGPTVSGAISSGLGALAAAAPWVAGAVAVFTLAKKAFGHGPKEMTGTSTLSGQITGGGTLDAVMLADWVKKGGWFSSDKHGTDRLPVNAELAKGIVDTYNTIKVSTMEYAKALGLNADSIANRAQSLNIAFGKDEEANKKAIADFFAKTADEVAREVLPSMDAFIKEGETAATTLQRLGTNAAGLEQALALMGTTMAAVFGEVDTASLLARERLVELAGGVQNLAAMSAYFQQNILTDADRAAAAQGPLNKALETLGYTSLKTTDDYKAAVLSLLNSGALLTEEGAKQYAGLLALGPQFKMVADYLKGVSDAAAESAKELAEAQAALLEQAKEANYEYLSNAVDAALAGVERAVDAEKDRVAKAFQATMRGLEKSIEEVNATIERTGALSKALKGAIQGPAGDNPMRGQIARAQISAALAIARASGVLPSLDSIADALATVTQDDSDNFATLQEYQRAVARTNAELESLGGLTDDQLTTAEKQLRVLEDQKAAAEQAYEAELARLDGILENAQAQVDALRGVDTSVRSVAAAIGSLQIAINAAKTAPTPANNPGTIVGGGNTPTTVADLYRQVLGRAPDADGLEFWTKAFGDAVDQSEYLEFMKSAKAELDTLLKGPPVVQGPNSGTMGGSSAMLAELQTLNARMSTVEVAMTTTANSTQQFAQQFNQVSAGGNALATEII